MKKRCVMFDFDGTVADTFDIAISVANKFAPKYGFAMMTVEESKAKLHDLSMKHWLKVLGIPVRHFPSMYRDFHAEFTAAIMDAQVFDGLLDVVSEMKSYDLKCGIVTSNSRAAVESFLEVSEINLFDFIYSSRNLFGKHRTLLRAAKSQQIDVAQIIYVGDEARDVEACRKIDMQVLSASWGFNSKSLLEQVNPGFVVDTPAELLSRVVELREG